MGNNDDRGCYRHHCLTLQYLVSFATIGDYQNVKDVSAKFILPDSAVGLLTIMLKIHNRMAMSDPGGCDMYHKMALCWLCDY